MAKLVWMSHRGVLRVLREHGRWYLYNGVTQLGERIGAPEKPTEADIVKWVNKKLKNREESTKDWIRTLSRELESVKHRLKVIERAREEMKEVD